MYILNEEKMFYDEADGIGIIINFTTGIYYSLNLIGTAIYRSVVANGLSVYAVIEYLKTCENCPKNIEELVLNFFEDLVEKEVLIKKESQEDIEIEIDIEKKDLREGFEPIFDEYSEVQDLILADPIHEVDPNLGWPSKPNE